MFGDINLDDYDGKVILGTIVGSVGFTLLTIGCLVRRHCRKRKYRSNTKLKGYRGGKSVNKMNAFHHADMERKEVPIQVCCGYGHCREHDCNKGYLQRSPFESRPYENREYQCREHYMYPPLPHIEPVYPQMAYVMTNHNGQHHLMSPPSYRVLPTNGIIKEENVKIVKEVNKKDDKNSEMSTQTDEEK
jgi:hypothetical protein